MIHASASPLASLIQPRPVTLARSVHSLTPWRLHCVTTPIEARLALTGLADCVILLCRASFLPFIGLSTAGSTLSFDARLPLTRHRTSRRAEQITFEKWPVVFGGRWEHHAVTVQTAKTRYYQPPIQQKRT